MACYGTNPEGVTALKSAAASLYSGADEISTLSNNIEAEADGNQAILGPHSAELLEAISEIKKAIEGVNSNIDIIGKKLKTLADDYEEIIARRLLKNGGKN